MIDPATYASQIPKEKIGIYSDEKVLATDQYFEGWPSADYDDSAWKNAVIVEGLDDSVRFALFDSVGIHPRAIWTMPKAPVMKEISVPDTVWNTKAQIDTLGADSSLAAEPDSAGNFLGSMMSSLDSSAVDSGRNQQYTIRYVTKMIPVAVDTTDTLTAFFRFKFNLDGRATGGKIYMTADDDFQLFINGEWIWDDEDNDYSVVDTIDYYTISDYLRTGTNSVGIKVTDYDPAPRLGLRFYIEIQYIPSSLQEQLMREEKVEPVVVEPRKLHQVMLVRKGRLITK
jgi:hypothetical protein